MPTFFIDHSALKNMFEGVESGDKLLRQMYDMKNQGIPVDARTTMSCFLRALYLTDPKVNINSIQKVLNFLNVIPSFADFKNDKAVINEILKIVGSVSKR